MFAYVFEGGGRFGGTQSEPTGDRSLLLFDDGDQVSVETGNDAVRFLLVSGKPLREPIAWRGPIVMNTAAELRTASDELDAGTFVKHARP